MPIVSVVVPVSYSMVVHAMLHTCISSPHVSLLVLAMGLPYLDMHLSVNKT